MTYRKIFLFLFLTGTLVLGAAWYFSLRTYYSFFISSPAGACALDLDHGTFGIFYFPSSDSWSQTFQTIPGDEQIGKEEDETSAWGKFEMGTMRSSGASGSTPPDRYVYFPVWLPYLLLTGGVLVSARLLKRRSDAANERDLATAHASASGAAGENR